MHNLTPQKIRQIAEITFAIEPILDKKDCTTRYIDLPGKKLSDFLIAGINVGPVVEEYARTVLEEKGLALYSHLLPALKVSNDYKSSKIINYGLLVLLFPAIRAVLQASSLEEALVQLGGIAKNSSRRDVELELEATEYAWQTSISSEKRARLEDMKKWFEPAQSYYERWSIFKTHLHDPADSSYQFAEEFLHNFPLVHYFVGKIDEEKGLIKSLEDAYNTLHLERPELRVGVLADVSACACFLYLCFQAKEYEVR